MLNFRRLRRRPATIEAFCNRLGGFFARLALICAALVSTPSSVLAKVLTLAPMASTRPGETHAALALSLMIYPSDIPFTGRVATLEQLRTGSAPNPWECAWIVWNYADPDHFYYLALKPNGWELGKRDPAYPGGQRFLATGSRKFKTESWTAFNISQRHNQISIEADNQPLVAFADTLQPVYKSGKRGLYTEDATVALDDMSIPLLGSFSGYAVRSTMKDGSTLGDWAFPFLGFGAASMQTDDKETASAQEAPWRCEQLTSSARAALTGSLIEPRFLHVRTPNYVKCNELLE